MEKISVSAEALPIVKSGIALKEKTLAVKERDYVERIRGFEKKHAMESQVFVKQYKSGKLGDDEEWLEWLFVHEAYSKIMEQRRIIRELLA